MKLPTPLRRGAAALRHSRAGDFAHAARNRLSLVGLRRGDVVGVDVAGAMGMGAVLTHLLMALWVCERLGLRPAIRFSNPLYARAGQRDWFAEFFEAVAPPVEVPRRWLRLQKDGDHRLMDSPTLLSLADGKALFDRHLRFRPFLHEAAAALFFPFTQPLGVHYRGTDKHDEAPVVQRDAAIAAVRRTLAQRHDVVFLATDEPAFETALRAAITEVPVVMYAAPGLIPEPGTPIHFWASDGHAKGVDALVNMLALSRCGTVVRTASFLSGWAKVLNPDQRVVMLNQAFSDSRFPDNVIENDVVRLDADVRPNA